MAMHPRITNASVAGRYRLRLRFADESVGVVDLTPWIEGRTGVFAALQDPAFFAKVAVDVEAGTVVWPNGADLDPDVLYEATHGVSAASPPAEGGV